MRIAGRALLSPPFVLTCAIVTGAINTFLFVRYSAAFFHPSVLLLLPVSTLGCLSPAIGLGGLLFRSRKAWAGGLVGSIAFTAPLVVDAVWFAWCMRGGDDNAERIVEAIERYRSDQGHLPPSLDDLVPSYLRQLPSMPTPPGTNTGRFLLMTMPSDADEYCLVAGYVGLDCWWCSGDQRPVRLGCTD